MTQPFTREDMVDAIATAIDDSMDMDWTGRTGAEAVVRNCGVFELYEALEQMRSYGCPVCSGDCGSANPPVVSCPMRIAARALAKVRGEPRP